MNTYRITAGPKLDSTIFEFKAESPAAAVAEVRAECDEDIIGVEVLRHGKGYSNVVQTALVCGSHGEFLINRHTGEVVNDPPGEYSDIVWCDVARWLRETSERELPESVDIISIGFLTDKYDYIDPAYSVAWATHCYARNYL